MDVDAGILARQKAQAVYDLLHNEHPDWLGGIVAGPSSRPIPELRNNVPQSKYPIRLYPDLTHNKICQYPVPWWDMAYAQHAGVAKRSTRDPFSTLRFTTGLHRTPTDS